MTHAFEVRRGLLRRRERFFFDDVERLDAAGAIALGRRIRLGERERALVREALDGPPLEGDRRASEEDRAALAAAFERWLAGPHAPRRVASRLLETAARLGASDLHLEPAAAEVEIRMRVDGALAPFAAAGHDSALSLVAALKGMAGCLPYRRDVVQEGRIPRDGIAADVRASFLPTAFGERVALRLFGRLRALDELGLGPTIRADFERALASRGGLLLVAGASGAGKTTTLYAALGHLCRSRPGAHLSIEDPVEQRLRAAGIPVDQVELDPARGITGESTLAAALRQDVDVIAVGEIRDSAEARLAIQAAHTGRLVLAGLHAGSPEEARLRMLDLGVEPSLLAATLRGVLHQQLAPGAPRALAARFEGPA